jgi:antitoxin PrlF
MSDKMTTVTSKGQVTIPAEIREYMDIKSGDQLLFVRDAERVYIELLPRKSTSDEVFGILRRPEQPPLDVEKARIEARARRSSRQKVGQPDEK